MILLSNELVFEIVIRFTWLNPSCWRLGIQLLLLYRLDVSKNSRSESANLLLSLLFKQVLNPSQVHVLKLEMTPPSSPHFWPPMPTSSLKSRSFSVIIVGLTASIDWASMKSYRSPMWLSRRLSDEWHLKVSGRCLSHATCDSIHIYQSSRDLSRYCNYSIPQDFQTHLCHLDLLGGRIMLSDDLIYNTPAGLPPLIPILTPCQNEPFHTISGIKIEHLRWIG